MRRLLHFAAVLAIAGGGLAVATLALVPQMADFFTAAHVETPDIDLDPLNQRSIVFAQNGSVVATFHAEENRSNVRLEDIPDEVVDTIIAVEDEDFYEHNGFNLRATIRALFENVSAGGIEQGGSTITQQLVKNSLLTPERDLNRKTQEAILAVELEEELSKDEILERYLNEVYFGGGAYGVQAAAELYWGLDVADLGYSHAALLASLIQNPVGYDPTRDAETALERRQVALDRLVEEDLITQAQADEFAAEPLPVARQEVLPPANDYFVEEVKQQLLSMEELGESQAERYNAVFNGGLRIYTTFNPAAQFLALAARDRNLPDTGGRFTAAMASVEPSTGAVRALVGGPGFENYRYNLATQGLRQPGSSFKIFVLVAALEQGLVPDDIIDGGSPCSFPNPGGAPDPYVANNYSDGSGGTGTIASQTTRSSNCAFLRLGQLVGLDNVVETARAMGITSDLNPDVLSMPIGSEEVSPLEMAGAAAVIANHGVRMEPYFIDRIEDRNGEVIWEHEAAGEQAISEQSACLATQVLQANVEGGTGTEAQLPGRPAAGKTGTAQNWGDAWFVGFTPQLATSVWMGNPAARVPMTGVGGRNVTGGSFPAMIWGDYMAAAHTVAPVEQFPGCFPTRPGRDIRSILRELTGEPEPPPAAPEEPAQPALSCPDGMLLADLNQDGVVESCVQQSQPAPVPQQPPPQQQPNGGGNNGGNGGQGQG